MTAIRKAGETYITLITDQTRRILPVLTLLFLCSFLDRTNVGNARLYNLEDDIGISDHQYDVGLAVFYASYIIRSVEIEPQLNPQLKVERVELIICPKVRCRVTWS